MKPTYVVLFLFLGLVSSQREVPEQLKCFIKGFFKCKDSLRNLCSEFPDFEDRRPVPIPKNRLNGTCPILGQELPLTEIKYIDLPPCPCQEGNPGVIVDICFTCLRRADGAVLKAPKEGEVTINCNEDNTDIDLSTSECLI